MRQSFLVPLLLLSACSVQKVPNEASPDSNGAQATGPAADPALQMASTSWQFTDPKVGMMTSSFDPNGRFRAEHEGNLVEQGSWATKQGKLCEDDDATHKIACYTLAATLPAIGRSMKVSTDNGQRLDVTRVAYQPSTADVLAGTSWTFTPDAKTGLITATFGTDGHYYDINKGKLVESGTFVTSAGKVCEDVDGTPANDHVCWTVPDPLPGIGGKAYTTSDKGQTVSLTRVVFAGDQARK